MALVEYNNLRDESFHQLYADVRNRLDDKSVKPELKGKLIYVPVAYSKVDDIVRDILSSRIHGVVLAGGAARSCVDWALGEDKPRDYDFFFETTEASVELEKFLVAKGFEITFVCPLGKLTSLEKKRSEAETVKVQLIKDKFFPEPISLIWSFDFTVTMFAISIDQPLLALTTDLAVYDAIQKVLRINRLEYPVATLNRVDKYLSYGYRPIHEFFRQIASAINEQIRKYVTEGDGSMLDEFGNTMRKYID